MPTTVYGVTPEGFRRKTQAEIIAEFETDQHADISASLDVSTESIVGQNNAIYGRALGIAWEILEILYHSNDPEASEGRLLEMVCKLTGTFREGDTYTTVTLACHLDDGTDLVSGTHFAALEDQPDVRFTPVEDFTADDGTRSYDVVFRCEQGGPIAAPAGEINVIATPLVGWNSVVNPNDADEGDRVESDTKLREKREQALAIVGSATVRAMTADLTKAFTGKLDNLIILENETDETDANGLPPHSVEVLFYDGLTPKIDNADMAQAILDAKAGGIQSFGSTTASAQALVNGEESTLDVGFTRAAKVEIYIEFDLEVSAKTYVGDAAVATYVAAECNKRFGPTKTVIASVVQSLPLQLAGVVDVIDVRIGVSPSPSGGANVPIDLRQIARFDSTRVVAFTNLF